MQEAKTFHDQFCNDFAKIVKDELSSTSTSMPKDNNEDIKKSVMFSLSSTSLLETYQYFFEELVDSLLNTNELQSKDQIRKELASALYEVAYSEAANIHNTYNGSNSNSLIKVLRVPWFIVKDALNAIKLEKLSSIPSTATKTLTTELDNMNI